MKLYISFLSYTFLDCGVCATDSVAFLHRVSPIIVSMWIDNFRKNHKVEVKNSYFLKVMKNLVPPQNTQAQSTQTQKTQSPKIPKAKRHKIPIK